MTGKTKVEDQALFRGQKKKKDLSHIQCFKCHKYKHYARQCHDPNKRKHEASIANVDEDTPHKRSRNDDFVESAEDRRKEFFF